MILPADLRSTRLDGAFSNPLLWVHLLIQTGTSQRPPSFLPCPSLHLIPPSHAFSLSATWCPPSWTHLSAASAARLAPARSTPDTCGCLAAHLRGVTPPLLVGPGPLALHRPSPSSSSAHLSSSCPLRLEVTDLHLLPRWGSHPCIYTFFLILSLRPLRIHTISVTQD